MQEERVDKGVAGDDAAAGEPVQVPTSEWTTAALAHACILLTLIFGTAGGIGAIVGPVVPLVMYLGYRERSRFVALQSLQAFAYQTAGLVAAAGLGVLVTLSWALTGVLGFAGVFFLPLALSVTTLLVGGILAWLGYGLYAAYQVYQGRDFRYWLIGDWVAREVRQ